MTRRRKPLRGAARINPPWPAGPTARRPGAGGQTATPAPVPRQPRMPVVVTISADGRIDLYCDRGLIDLAVVRLPPLCETATVEATRDELIGLSIPRRHRSVLYHRNLWRLDIMRCPATIQNLAEMVSMRMCLCARCTMH